MGYFCNAVFGGSKGLNSGLSDNAYSNSPNELSKPAPNALISPSCLHKPNSTVNQKIVASFAISSSDAPNDAKPISCEKSAKSGSANYMHKRNKLDGDNRKDDMIMILYQGNVTQQFMTNIGFRGIERFRSMTNILCRIKDTEGKGVQEITTR